MKTAVIDSLEHISVLGNAGSTPELAAISGDDPEESCEAQDELERLAVSLALDEEAEIALMGIGSQIFTSGAESGFRRGFRVAVRLMVESLGGRKASVAVRRVARSRRKRGMDKMTVSDLVGRISMDSDNIPVKIQRGTDTIGTAEGLYKLITPNPVWILKTEVMGVTVKRDEIIIRVE